MGKLTEECYAAESGEAASVRSNVILSTIRNAEKGQLVLQAEQKSSLLLPPTN